MSNFPHVEMGLKFRVNLGSPKAASLAVLGCTIILNNCGSVAFSRPVTAMPPSLGAQGPQAVKLSPYAASSATSAGTSLNITETFVDLYTLGPGDGLTLVFLDPELKSVGGAVSILPDGTAILPLIGSVQLSGLTIGQATRWLTSLYEKQVVRPQLLLQLVSPRPTKVTIVGEVLNPGLYELGSIPRVARAVMAAGGISANADIRKVLLRRVVGQNGTQKQTYLDLSQVFY